LVTDINGDGRPDVIIRDRVWFGLGLNPGTYVSLTQTNMQRPEAIVAAADMDGDGRVDLIGHSPGEGLSRTGLILWNEQDGIAPASRPPANLSAGVGPDSVVLSWAPGGEECGRFSTYNLRIGTAPGLSDVISALSTPEGARKISGPGNMGGSLRRVLKLPQGTYYWAVQEVNPAGIGGPFREGETFVVASPDASQRNLPPLLQMASQQVNFMSIRDVAWLRFDVSDREQPTDTLALSAEVVEGRADLPTPEIVTSGTNHWLVVRTSERSSGSYRIRVSAVDSGNLITSVFASIEVQGRADDTRLILDRLGYRTTSGSLLVIPFQVESYSGLRPNVSATLVTTNTSASVSVVRSLQTHPRMPEEPWELRFVAPDMDFHATNQLIRVRLRVASDAAIVEELQILVEPGPLAAVTYPQGYQFPTGAAADVNGDGNYESWFADTRSFAIALSPSNTFQFTRFVSRPVSGNLRFADWLGDGTLQAISMASPVAARQLSLPDGPAEAFAVAPTNFPALSSQAFGDLDGDGDEDAIGFERTAATVILTTRSNLFDSPRTFRASTTTWSMAAISPPDRLSPAHWALGRSGNALVQVGEIRHGLAVTNYIQADPARLTGFSQLGWADVDGDGLQDIWLAGSADRLGNVIQIYRRLDAPGYEFAAPQTITNSIVAFREWHDMDGDGRLDVPLIRRRGTGQTLTILELWTAGADGLLRYSRDWVAPLSAVPPQFIPGDYNGDGRPDLLKVTPGTGANAILIRRGSEGVTLPPVPARVRFARIARLDPRVEIRWEAAGGPEMTYNLRIGTTRGGSELVSPLSDPSGRRKVFRHGNAGSRTNFVFDPSRTSNTRIYVAVQAVTSSFVGGAFSEEIEIDLDVNTPPTVTAAATSELRAGEDYSFEARVTDDVSYPVNVRIRSVIEDAVTAPVTFSQSEQVIYPTAEGVARLSLRALPESAGRAVLRIEATDEAGQSVTNRFNLVVLPTNTAPFLAAPRHVTAAAGITTFTVWVGDRESESRDLNVSVAWSTPTNTVPVQISGQGAARSVAIDAGAGPAPTGDLLVTVEDTGGLLQTARVTIGPAGAGTGQAGWQLAGDAPPEWTAHATTTGSLRIIGRADAGARYRLEASEDLSAWKTVSEGVANGALVEAEIPVTGSIPNKLFHRMVRVD
jgi:hypothetical protein